MIIASRRSVARSVVTPSAMRSYARRGVPSPSKERVGIRSSSGSQRRETASSNCSSPGRAKLRPSACARALMPVAIQLSTSTTAPGRSTTMYSPGATSAGSREAALASSPAVRPAALASRSKIRRALARPLPSAGAGPPLGARAMPSTVAAVTLPTVSWPSELAKAVAIPRVEQKPAVSSPPAASTNAATNVARSPGPASAVARSAWATSSTSAAGASPGQCGSAGRNFAAVTAAATSLCSPSGPGHPSALPETVAVRPCRVIESVRPRTSSVTL